MTTHAIIAGGGVMLGSGNTYENHLSHRGDAMPERDIQYPEGAA